MSNSRDSEQDRRKQEEDPFTRSTRQFDSHISSLFSTLWGLPAQIYQRGNEHGREFSRLIDERHQRRAQHEHESRGEREDEQEQEDARGSRACGWRGRDRWQRAREQRQQRDAEEQESVNSTEQNADSTSPESWLTRITSDMEKRNREAQKIFDEYEQKVLQAEKSGENGQEHANNMIDQLMRNFPNQDKIMEQIKAQIKAQPQKYEETWAEIFPAWSKAHADMMGKTMETRKVAAEEDHDNEQGTYRPGPIVATAQQVEDAINQAHADMTALMRGTTDMARHLREGYNREARLWDMEGLFGSNMPFSGPLSAIMSLGMRSFVPQDSAIGYLLFSEYSPLHLEHEEGFDRTFRRRFEDLVRVQSGKEMRAEDDAPENNKFEWLGMMDALVNSRHSPDKHDDWTTICPRQKEFDEAIETEMDVYERQLAGQYSPSPALQQALELAGDKRELRRANIDNVVTSVETPASEKSGVLSTLTTTERHVAADGTVTEKTVLKKRFADGREETESSTTTTEADPTPSWARYRQYDSPAQKTLPDNKIVKEAKRSGGWFWSS